MSAPTTAPRLSSALKRGKDALSPEAAQAILALNVPRPGRFLLEVAKVWSVIAAAIVLAIWADHGWVSVIAIIVVATRQNCLGLLVHEQTHLGLGGRSGDTSFIGRYGDWICNLLCAYPLLVLSVEGYAKVHLTHHNSYFKEGDPDYARKSGEEWAFPKSGWALFKLFLGDLLGLNTLKLIEGKKAVGGQGLSVERRNPVPKWLRPAFLLALIAALTYFHAWGLFLLYWFLPLMVGLPAIVRWGAICEHEYNRLNADMLESTPIIIQPWWERLLMPMLNFGMHAYHHLWPGISFSRLEGVHAIFEREGLVHEDRIFHGSAQYLHFLLGKPHGEPVGSQPGMDQ